MVWDGRDPKNHPIPSQGFQQGSGLDGPYWSLLIWDMEQFGMEEALKIIQFQVRDSNRDLDSRVFTGSFRFEIWNGLGRKGP